MPSPPRAIVQAARPNRCQRCQARRINPGSWRQWCVACETELEQLGQECARWRFEIPAAEIAGLSVRHWIHPNADWQRTLYPGEQFNERWKGAIVEGLSVRRDDFPWALIFTAPAEPSGWFPWVYKEPWDKHYRAFLQWTIWLPGVRAALVLNWRPPGVRWFDLRGALADPEGAVRLGQLANLSALPEAVAAPRLPEAPTEVPTQLKHFTPDPSVAGVIAQAIDDTRKVESDLTPKEEALMLRGLQLGSKNINGPSLAAKIGKSERTARRWLEDSRWKVIQPFIVAVIRRETLKTQ